MRILIYFVLFLITKNVCTTPNIRDQKLRKNSANKVNNILGLVEKWEELEEFRKTVEASYNGSNFRVIEGQTIETTVCVRDFLNIFNRKFIRLSFSYINQSILEYCILVLDIIAEQKYKNGKTIRKQIRFPKKQEYCMLTAFYDDSHDVDWMFEIIFFFQTIRPDDEYTLTELESQLKEYVNSYAHYLKPTSEPTTKSVDSLARIQQIKQDITAYSNMFCSYWRPFLSYRFNEKTLIDGVRYGSVFVKHVFHNEMCRINFKPLVLEEHSPYQRKFYVKNQQNWIKRWDCSKILENQDYRLLKYMADTLELTGDRQFMIKKMKMYSDLKPVGELNEYSLAMLQHVLKSNNYYLNYVTYYNIVSNVMLFVSIKEGKKILKGIKHVVQKKCYVENGISQEEIRKLILTLSSFKSVLDRLLFLILDKNLIDVISMRGERQKKIFDALVDTFMELLDVDNQKVDQEHRICIEIPKAILSSAYLGNMTDAILSELNFERFYFTEPILNVAQLCHFVDDNFV